MVLWLVIEKKTCFNIEFVHYACLCTYVHTLRNTTMTAPPYSCDKLIMVIHGVIYSWKCAKMAEKVMNYTCSRFNVFFLQLPCFLYIATYATTYYSPRIATTWKHAVFNATTKISLPTDHSRQFLNAADVDWNSDDSDIGF